MSNLPSLILCALSYIAVEGGVVEEMLTFEFIPVFLVLTTSELMSPSQSQEKKGALSVEKLEEIVPNLTDCLLQSASDESVAMEMADLVCFYRP